MIRLLLGLFCLGTVGGLWAQEPGPRPPNIVMHLTPRVVETNKTVSWEEPLVQATEPGKAVVVRIDAQSLAIRVSVTPFYRDPGFLLVVQGDVQQTIDGSIRRSTSVQTVNCPPGESIAFFPLGRPADLNSGRLMVVYIKPELASE